MTTAVSGLLVTDGAAINLVDVNGDGSVIVGVVQAGSPFAGQAAFAISIDSGTGRGDSRAVSVAAPGQPRQHAE